MANSDFPDRSHRPVSALVSSVRGLVAPLPLLGIVYAACFIVFTAGAGTLFPQPPYWADWSDQGEYWRSATAFARGDLAAAQHWYPLLYPLLLAPFVWLGFPVATFLTSLLLYLVTYLGFQRVARHFAIKPWQAGLVFVASTLALPNVGKVWVEPWTTTLSAALIWCALAVAADWIARPRDPIANRTAVTLGILLALIPCTRPTDIVVSAIIGLFVAGHLLFVRRDLRPLAILVASGTAVLAAYGALYLAIWGPAPSTYMKLGSALGFDFAMLGWKAYLIIIEPRPWFPYGTGILKAVPWLLLGAGGAIVMLIGRETRLLAGLVVLPALAYAVMMLAFVDLLPSGLWRFNNVHYFKWIFPLLGLFAWTFVAGFRASRAKSATVLCALVAVSSLRMVPEPAAADRPARLLVYQGTDAPFAAVYQAKTVIADRSGSLRNFFDYHQVPSDAGTIHVDALRRDFRGGEKLSGRSRPQDWPDAPRGFYSDGAAGAASFGPLIGRYRPRLALGVPCWLPGYECPFVSLKSDRP